jgi:hypothetical protein
MFMFADDFVNPPKKSRMPLLIAALLSVFSALPLFAQEEGPVVITAPAEWSTLRSDSVTVSLQVDTAALPRGVVDFKVLRRSGARSSVLFSRTVKADESAADAYLGSVKGLPVGGGDYLRIEWSVPGTELKGAVEPVGMAVLKGSVSAENKWVPANPYLSAVRLKDGAVRLKDGIDAESVSDALGKLKSVSVGGAGADFAVGWNASELVLYFTPTAAVPEAEFALDLKFGANAFTAWADRFITVTSDSAYGLRVSKRSVDSTGAMKFEESPWGDSKLIASTKYGAGCLVALDWNELGVQPFEGRNIGFAVFAKGRGKSAVYPAGANRSIPGTWGGISLFPHSD